ncbi:serine/threonine-protein kinase [Streptomyces panaciradicis]|uniref:serine/threonine-protein kinase n=1 Tax=Streptomyces panaciradicis TaxID=1470261 RepID=UPI00201CEA16|nr:serine/threonine-protein kinase [Streptomyces panaciradicis]MCL6673860.1 serine/threonine protein kinase [Streptomyces panaciradicis]
MSAGGEQTREGRLLGGRYRLTERIGSGGMGTVWQAHDELVDRDVAVKEPRLPGDPRDEHRQRAAHRLHREARAAARVDHPAAVSIHDVVVEEDGLPWIVMELVRGESLHEVLRRGPVDAREAARIGLAVLGALGAAHAVGIVHRDVKPANVLLGPHGRVVLTDFGIAHVQGEESLTMSGEFVGSLEFIAPERMSGRGAGPSSDLWSLGVLLYAAVEGASPFRRTTVESTLAAVIACEPPEPKQAGPLRPLIARLLLRDPEQRPGARETEAVLEAVAEGWPVPVLAEGEVTQAQEASLLEEFGEDAGTVRLGGGVPASQAAPPEPVPEPEAAPPEPVPETAATTTVAPAPRRPAPRRRAVLAVAAVALVGGTWFAASRFAGPAGESVTEHTATYRSAPARATPAATASPSTGAWVAHRPDDMDAVLVLPAAYKESAREGGTGGRPRLVVYDTGLVQVRLTEWDRAPGTPLDAAKKAFDTWNGAHRDASGSQYRTSHHGLDAAVADTTYGLKQTPTRVVQLFLVTADDRMYELRVDMPKGTPGEREGMAVFKEARDRLVIGKSGTTASLARPTP